MADEVVSAPALHGKRSQAHRLIQDAAPQKAESSACEQQVKRPSVQYATNSAHDVFLSHSGAQKGFVKDLYQQLTLSSFTTFFDITHHSLPPGVKFPSRIFQAAKSCSLALVVLSEDFVSSKWPMLELCTFVDSIVSRVDLKLVPLFFKLSPADLKSPKNLQRWRRSWKALVKQDYKCQIDVSKWAPALQSLCTHNGVVFNPDLEGEQTYIDRIVSAVSQVLPPAFKFDTTHISGKDRLSKVILDKFQEMELYQSGMTLVSHGASSSTASQPKPCVLGLYGLPGSGKTTLCKCLLDHSRPFYGNSKTHYLEFPSTASHADVVDKLKELVIHITDFRNRVSLDRVSDIENVVGLLKTYQFSSCKVFLVVDNISESSWEAIDRILHLGFGEGSKIILVARTLDVLRPTLDSLACGLHWACGSLVVPSINEMEASEILLKTAKGSCVGFPESLSSKHMERVKAIVRMCSFGQVWLPLVMKAMGARLLKYEDKGGWEEWENDSIIFWTRVKTYKQRAVIEELLGENFKALLKEHLQLVFLDVALFFLQLSEWQIETVCASLSMMHGFTSFEIKMMIRDLERCCFLAVSAKGVIHVHDVYMEFAMSIKDGPSKHLGSTAISSRWEHCKVADVPEAGSKSSLLKRNDQGEGGLIRALILEVGEGYERVDLQGFSALKAMALISNRKSMRVLGLVGLSSLAILEIKICAKFNIQLDCDDDSVQNIKQLGIIRKQPSKLEEEREMQLAHHKFQESEQVSYLHSIVNVVRRSILMAPFRQPSSLEVGLLASRMRSLEVLHLQSTGITRLELSNLSQLRELTIAEQHLERLALGYLPNLTQFLFRDSTKLQVGDRRHYTYCENEGIEFYFEDSEHAYPSVGTGEIGYGQLPLDNAVIANLRRKMGNSRYELVGKDFLKGCPQLKRVSMASPFIKQGQLGSLPAGLERFELFVSESFELPDLSLSAYTLEQLHIAWCQKLERVNFDIGFERLKSLDLGVCDNLVEVTGLGCLPSLRRLSVNKCMRLQKLIGFDNCRLLNTLYLSECPELTEISCFNSLLNLEYLHVLQCHNLEELSMQKVCDLEKLRECRLHVYCGECSFSLRNCKNLEVLEISQQYSPGGAVLKLEDLDNLVKLVELCLGGGGPSIRQIISGRKVIRLSSLDLKAVSSSLDYQPFSTGCLPSMSSLDLKVLSTGCLPSLRRLELENLDLNNLRSLHVVECLTNLRQLRVEGCPLLEELHGLECLTNLDYLRVKGCPLLEELHGLECLTNLNYLRVTGCSLLEELHGLECLTNLKHLGVTGCPLLEELHGLECLTNLGFLGVTGCPLLEELHGLECLTNLWHLEVHDCPLLEELPSLCKLMSMRILNVVNCPKLKALEGCDYMEQLVIAALRRCKSMERFPFTNNQMLQSLSFSGCKFASNNVEQMAAWATEEEVAKPTVFRLACVGALVWEYYNPSNISACLADAAGAALHKDRVAASLWCCLVRWRYRNEHLLHEKVALIATVLQTLHLYIKEGMLVTFIRVLLEWEAKVAKGRAQLRSPFSAPLP